MGYLKRGARQSAVLRPAYPLPPSPLLRERAGDASVPQAGYLKRKQAAGRDKTCPCSVSGSLIVPQTGYLKIICRVHSVEVRALAPQKLGLIRRLRFNFVEAVLSGSLRFA